MRYFVHLIDHQQVYNQWGLSAISEYQRDKSPLNDFWIKNKNSKNYTLYRLSYNIQLEKVNEQVSGAVDGVVKSTKLRI